MHPTHAVVQLEWCCNHFEGILFAGTEDQCNDFVMDHWNGARDDVEAVGWRVTKIDSTIRPMGQESI